MKRLAVMGCTGSIGTTTLSLVDDYPDAFQVVALAAGTSIEKLEVQIRKYRPRYVSVLHAEAADRLRRSFPEVSFGAGESGMREAVSLTDVDMVVMGIVGFAALEPTLHALRAGKALAMASKEVLVVAGALFRDTLQASGSLCIPVDSEHNAVFQLLEKCRPEQVATIVLTASGGPLLRRPEIPLEDVTPEIATKHPNWKMGPKISVDSATLMNKGLELIEAHYLFGTPPEQIEIWVHPQSLVHGALWLKDNTCLAQLTKPDMRSSIGFALSYPDRLVAPIAKLSFAEMAKLEFLPPDEARFPALRLARQALQAGPSHLVVLNAANEIAVERFLKGSLLFSQIPQLVEIALERHDAVAVGDLESILQVDHQTRQVATRLGNFPAR